MIFATKIEHSIGYITINKPPVNALNSEDWINFYILFDDLVFKEEIKVIIINSSGKGFCAGADLNEHKNLTSIDKLKVSEKIYDGVWKAIQAIERSYVPVIVNCSNYVVGAGMLVAMSADFIFAEANTQFQLPGINFGVFAGTSNALSMMPPSLAKKMLFTGEPIFAEELIKYGSILEICKDKDSMNKASYDLARTLASHNKEHLALLKSLILKNNGQSTNLKKELDATLNALKSLD